MLALVAALAAPIALMVAMLAVPLVLFIEAERTDKLNVPVATVLALRPGQASLAEPICAVGTRARRRPAC